MASNHRQPTDMEVTLHEIAHLAFRNGWMRPEMTQADVNRQFPYGIGVIERTFPKKPAARKAKLRLVVDNTRGEG